MDYMTVIWIVIIGAVILSALIVWSSGETRRHQQRGGRSRAREGKINRDSSHTKSKR